VAHHLHACNSGWFQNFSGWFPTLLLAITYFASTQMGHVSSFLKSTFKNISNGIRKYSIQWVLTFQIILWRFKISQKLQLLKWECVSSFPHTFLHYWECECDSQVALLACTFPCPCLGREPKVRVMTNKPKPNSLKKKTKNLPTLVEIQGLCY